MQIAKEVFDAFTQGSNQCCKSWLFLQRIGLNLGAGGGGDDDDKLWAQSTLIGSLFHLEIVNRIP